jgi:protein-tyrosine-phosphatase
LGNVARSQMAEGFYNKKTRSNNATSAGILDFTPEKYVHPNKEAIYVMNEEGIDISNYSVKTIKKDMLKKVDEIYIMCKKTECPLFLLKGKNITFWKIDDPDGSSLDNYRNIRNQIKEKVNEII